MTITFHMFAQPITLPKAAATAPNPLNAKWVTFLDKASECLGASILPPGLTPEKARGLTFQEFRSEWPARAEAFLEVIKARQHAQPLTPDRQQQLSQSLRIMNSLGQYLCDHALKAGPLREPQVAVVEDILAAFERGENRIYIKNPTGFGKTVIFAVTADAAGEKTLVSVPKRLLVKQTHQKFDRFAPIRTVAELYGEKKEAPAFITIMTYDYLYQLVEKGHDLSQYGLIILDEAHKVLGPKGKKFLAKLPHHIKVVGVTATPKYDEFKSLDVQFGPCCHRVDLPEGIRLGSLAPCSVFVAQTKVDISAVKRTEAGDYDEATLTKIYREQGVNKAAVDLYLKAFPTQSAIAFCNGIKHAEDAAEEFNKAGIKAIAISGKTPKKERERILEAYNAGDYQVLTSSDLLIEGFDSERATVCLNLTPTRSIVTAEQRGGRVSRLDPNNPLKHSVVIDFLLNDDKAKDPPILFVEIIKGTCCPPPSEQDTTVKTQHEALCGVLRGIEIEGLNVVVDMHEIMKISQDLELKARKASTEFGFVPAPEGWLSINELADLAGKSREAVRNSIYRLGTKVKPLYGRFYLGDAGRRVERFSPDLAPMVLAERKDLLKDAGWKTLTELERSLNTTPAKLQNALPKDLVEGVDFVVSGRTGRLGQAIRLFSPELGERIKVSQGPPRTFNLLGMQELDMLFKAPRFVGQSYLASLRAKMPEDFFVDTSGKLPKLYYSPEAAAELSKMAESWLERAPNGDIKVSTLAEQLGTTSDAIVKCVSVNQDSTRLMTAAKPVGTHVSATAPLGANTTLSFNLERSVRHTLCPSLSPPPKWVELPHNLDKLTEKLRDRYLELLPPWWKIGFRKDATARPVEFLHPKAAKVIDAILQHKKAMTAAGQGTDIDYNQIAWTGAE